MCLCIYVFCNYVRNKWTTKESYLLSKYTVAHPLFKSLEDYHAFERQKCVATDATKGGKSCFGKRFLIHLKLSGK